MAMADRAEGYEAVAFLRSKCASQYTTRARISARVVQVTWLAEVNPQ